MHIKHISRSSCIPIGIHLLFANARFRFRVPFASRVARLSVFVCVYMVYVGVSVCMDRLYNCVRYCVNSAFQVLTHFSNTYVYSFNWDWIYIYKWIFIHCSKSSYMWVLNWLYTYYTKIIYLKHNKNLRNSRCTYSYIQTIDKQKKNKQWECARSVWLI